MKQTYHVLDKGFLTYLDRFGDELTIVNSARVSFGKSKDVMDESDKKLLRYLIRHHHTSPFRHVFFRFHIKAPEFVLRQWFKHVVGIEWTTNTINQLHGWNEISGRYVAQREFYSPKEWRKQSESKKQGSDGVVKAQDKIKDLYNKYITEIERLYKEFESENVAKEQIRLLLPLSVYTECIWTVSLQALWHFIRLRDADDAQYEIREYARVCSQILEKEFPNCFQELMS